MKRIFWVSRHAPTNSQRIALQRLFGSDVQIFLHPDPFQDAKEIDRLMKRGRYDEIVLIAPLSVCKEMLALGHKPLHSQMTLCPEEESEVTVSGTRERLQKTKRYYKFVKFKRLVSIDMRFEDLVS